MTKSELITRLCVQNPHLTRGDIERVVAVVFDEMRAALVGGGRVEVRGFGSFFVRVLRARPGRNPRTGATIPLRASAHPAFKAGKVLQARLNAGSSG